MHVKSPESKKSVAISARISSEHSKLLDEITGEMVQRGELGKPNRNAALSLCLGYAMRNWNIFGGKELLG